MKRTQLALSETLPAMALCVALCFAGRPMFAQSGSNSSRDATTQEQAAQEQPMQPDDQNAAVMTTFSGKIVKSGSKLVLTDAGNKTIYQLDDQQKAHDFLNKSVKVTGVLDPSTGTIRVTAIEPV